MKKTIIAVFILLVALPFVAAMEPVCEAKAKIDFIQVENLFGGDAQNVVFPGGVGASPVADGELFDLYRNNQPIQDLSVDHDVPGISIHRVPGAMMVMFHGEHERISPFPGIPPFPSGREAVEATITLEGARILGLFNSVSNGFNSQGDGIAEFNNPGQDEYTQLDDYSVHVVSGVSTGSDSFVIVYDCEEVIPPHVEEPQVDLSNEYFGGERLRIMNVDLPAGIASGRDIPVKVTIENGKGHEVDDVRVRVSIPQLGAYGPSREFDLQQGDEESHTVYLRMPYYIMPGEYDIRIVAGNSKTHDATTRRIHIY